MNTHRRLLRISTLLLALGFSGTVLRGASSDQSRPSKGSKGVREVNPAEKLERIIVPRVEISDAPLADALEFLRIRSEDLDTTVAEGRAGRGLNFIIKDPAGELSEKGITLTLTRVPLKTVLDYVTRFAGVAYRVDAHAVVIGKPEDLGGDTGMILPGRLGGEGRMVFERLRDVRLPAVSIEDASIEDAIQYFRAVSVPGGDEGGAEEARGKGLNFVFKNPEEEVPRISLNLKDVPLGTALRYACELSGLVYTVHPNAVVIGRADDLVPRPADPGAHAYGRSGVRPGGVVLAAKLRDLVIPQVELNSATLEDALNLVRVTALNAERAAGAAEPKGVNIVNLAQDNTQRITLSLTDIPAWELMTYISGLTDTEFRVERLAVMVDWRLPRRDTVEKKEGVRPLEVPKLPELDDVPKVLQVPILNRDDPFGLLPDSRISPLVVPAQ